MARRRRGPRPDPERTDALLRQVAADQERQARRYLADAVDRGEEFRRVAARLHRLARWRRVKRASLEDRLGWCAQEYALALRLWLAWQSGGRAGPRPPDWMADDLAEMREIMARERRAGDLERARQRSFRRYQRRLRRQDAVDPAERAFLEYAKRYVYER